MKKCTRCKVVYEYSKYCRNKAQKDGYHTCCKECHKIYNKQWSSTDAFKVFQEKVKKAYATKYRKAHKDLVNAYERFRKSLKRAHTPKWANLKLIAEFYKNCPQGCHVDHIIPLKGKNISGLHVLNNLQYLPAKLNLSKGNRFGGVS